MVIFNTVGILVGTDQVFATPNGTYFPHDIEGSTTFLYRSIQHQGYSSQAYLNAFAYGTTPAFDQSGTTEDRHATAFTSRGDSRFNHVTIYMINGKPLHQCHIGKVFG